MSQRDTPPVENHLLRKALDAVQDGDLTGARHVVDSARGSGLDMDQVFRLYQVELEAQAEQLRDSQMRTEQALDWFSNLFRTLPVAALLVNGQGLVEDANAQAVDDLSLAGALRTLPLPLRRLMADAGGEVRLASLLSRARIGSTESLDDVALRTLDGRLRWADLRVTQVPPRAGEGLQPMFLCVINDRTARVEGQRAREAATRAEFERDAAQAASRSKTQLLSRVSHELRTPLNAVIGFSHLLQTAPDALAPGDLARVGHILDAGRHLLALVDDILQINQAENGALTLKLQPVGLTALTRRVLALQQPAIDAQGLSASLIVMPGTDDQVLADEKRVHEVLDNLLSNAIKYNRPGGWINLRIGNDALHARVTVEDGGVGLNPEQMAHLFEPFNRLGADRSDVHGHGLGLSISRAIAHAMGGHLQASSQPGVGSSFELQLPRAVAPH